MLSPLIAATVSSPLMDATVASPLMVATVASPPMAATVSSPPGQNCNAPDAAAVGGTPGHASPGTSSAQAEGCQGSQAQAEGCQGSGGQPPLPQAQAHDDGWSSAIESLLQQAQPPRAPTAADLAAALERAMAAACCLGSNAAQHVRLDNPTPCSDAEMASPRCKPAGAPLATMSQRGANKAEQKAAELAEKVGAWLDLVQPAEQAPLALPQPKVLSHR